MPWIKVIPESEAQGELKEVYRKLHEQRKGEKILQERSRGCRRSPHQPAHVAQPQSQGHVAHRRADVGNHAWRVPSLQGAAGDDRHRNLGSSTLSF